MELSTNYRAVFCLYPYRAFLLGVILTSCLVKRITSLYSWRGDINYGNLNTQWKNNVLLHDTFKFLKIQNPYAVRFVYMMHTYHHPGILHRISILNGSV